MISKAQHCRLVLERKLLAKEMPHFHLYNIDGNAYVSGWQTTRGSHQNYQLKLVLGYYFPDEMPNLYIVSPHTLWKADRYGTINEEETSHAFHTLSNGPNGCVQICHFKHESWDASKTCVGVLIKGVIWLEAYEAHLRTGKDIADFCV